MTRKHIETNSILLRYLSSSTSSASRKKTPTNHKINWRIWCVDDHIWRPHFHSFLSIANSKEKHTKSHSDRCRSNFSFHLLLHWIIIYSIRKLISRVDNFKKKTIFDQWHIRKLFFENIIMNSSISMCLSSSQRQWCWCWI